MRSLLLLGGVLIALIWVVQAQQAPAVFNPDPQDYPQVDIPTPTWVEAAPGCKILFPDYEPGKTAKWQGSSKEGKAHGKGTCIYYDKLGNEDYTVEGEMQQGLWQGPVRLTAGDGVMEGQMQDSYLQGKVQLNTSEYSLSCEMVDNVMCGAGKRVMSDGTTEEGFFLHDMLVRGQVKTADGQIIYWEEREEVEALSPEKPYTPALGVQLVEYLDESGRLCERAQAQYYRVVTYKAPFRPQGLVRDYLMDGTLQTEFEAIYLDSRYLTHTCGSGIRREYDKTGILLLDYHYSLGHPHGMSVTYWPNGRKKRQVVYIGGKGYDGPLREWNEAGYLTRESQYDIGRLVEDSRQEYDQAGRHMLAHLVNFRSDMASWQQQDDGGSSEVLTSYKMGLLSEDSTTVLRYGPVLLSEQDDYEITAWLRPMQAGRYGLLFGVQDDGNHISFELDGAGRARLCRTDEGILRELKPWTSFPAGVSGQEYYLLTVVCQQGQWHFFCQGQELFVLPAEMLSAYNFGFLAEGKMIATDLEVREAQGTVEQVPAPFPAVAPLLPLATPKWVQAAPGCEVLEPRFQPGVTLKWEGPVQRGKAHGQGRLTRYVDGHQDYLFEGSCQQGIPTGKGKRTDANGLVWEGNFTDGLPHGQQHVVWPDGRDYRGQVMYGIVHGDGKMSYMDGDVFEGFVTEGLAHTGRLTTAQGGIRYYKKHEEVAPFTAKPRTYTPALGVPLVEYQDSLGNRCNKEQAIYYREITYKAPFTPQGWVRDYRMDGTLRFELQALYLDADDTDRAFYQGEQRAYYRNGKLRTQWVNDRNSLYGKAMTYTWHGKPLREEYWQYGKEHGLHRTWDEESGRLHSEVSYVNGTEIERWEMYYQREDGSVYRQRVYTEEFNGDVSAWEKLGTASLEDTQMVALQGQADKQSWILRDIPLTQQNQYLVYGLMGLKEPREGVSYGLLLGYKDASNHCELLVRHVGKGGEMAFFCTQNGVRRMLMPWTPVPLKERSELAVIRDGHMKAIIDNDTSIELPLTQLPGHRFGACLRGEGVLLFDKFGAADYVKVQPEQ